MATVEASSEMIANMLATMNKLMEKMAKGEQHGNDEEVSQNKLMNKNPKYNMKKTSNSLLWQMHKTLPHFHTSDSQPCEQNILLDIVFQVCPLLIF